MAGAMTNYLENKMIDFVLRGQALNFPPNLYVGLYTTPTNESGGGAEVVGSGYARVTISRSLLTWAGTQGVGTTNPSDGTSGTTSNNSVITFSDPLEDWGTVVDLAIMDSATGGNMLYYAHLAIPKTIHAGDSAPSFQPADITISIDS